MVDGIMMFQNDENSEFFREPLFAAYPQIEKNHFISLDTDKRGEYIHQVMKEIYLSEESVISDKLIKYQQHWQNNKTQIEDAFSTVFQLDCQSMFNKMVGNITLNPIEPRWLASTSFCVFYLNSERGLWGQPSMRLYILSGFMCGRSILMTT